MGIDLVGIDLDLVGAPHLVLTCMLAHDCSFNTILKVHA